MTKDRIRDVIQDAQHICRPQLTPYPEWCFLLQHTLLPSPQRFVSGQSPVPNHTTESTYTVKFKEYVHVKWVILAVEEDAKLRVEHGYWLHIHTQRMFDDESPINLYKEGR